MRGIDLQRRRKRLGLSEEELAEEFMLRPEQIRDWERSGEVPKRQARRLEWYLAGAEREKALESSHLPTCDWATQWDKSADVFADGYRDQLASLEAHTKECAVCRSREQYLQDRFGPMPPYPQGPILRVLGPLMDLFDMPRGWERGLAMAGVVFILFGLARLLRHLPFWEPLGVLVYLLAVSAAAILLFGLYYSLAPLHEKGALGRWFARCIAGMAAMVAFTGMFIISGYGSVLDREGDPVDWGQGIGIGLAMGIMYATLWPIAKHWRR